MLERKFGIIGSSLVAIALAFGGCAGKPSVRYPIVDRMKEIANTSYCASGQVNERGYCLDAQSYPLVSIKFKNP